MAFEATLDITINGVTKSLKRIRDDGYSSEYLLRSTIEEFRCFVRHSVLKPRKGAVVPALLRDVERHNMEWVHRIFATSTTPEVTRRAYCVYEVAQGDDVTAAKNFVVGALAKSASAGLVDDMLNMLS